MSYCQRNAFENSSWDETTFSRDFPAIFQAVLNDLYLIEINSVV